MYQNPGDRRQIWINIGWNTKGAQRYPAYHSGLSAYISEEAYNDIIYTAQQEFANPPFGGVCFGLCAMACCFFTCGICFCPCLYACCKVKSFNGRVNNSMAAVGQRLGMKIHYRLVEGAATPGAHQWVDSNGVALQYGPPLGCNIIITLPANISWPPRHVVAAAPRNTAAAPPRNTANAPTRLTAAAPQRNTAYVPPTHNAPSTHTAYAPQTHTASAPQTYEDIAPPRYEESAEHPPAYTDA